MKLQKIICSLVALALLLVTAPAFDVAALAADVPYRIGVDITNQIVTIYDNHTGAIVRQCLCSSGKNDCTPLGTFTMPANRRSSDRKEWRYFSAYGVYAQYASRIYKGIMFHSIPCYRKTQASICPKELADFGTPTSHGCMRLRWQDAEFIAKNCLQGTKVKIYKSRQRDEDLRELLLQSSYTGENGQTYEQYLGIPDEPGVMGRYSEGEDVRDLQLRLRDLGLFTDDITGVYRGATVTAVRNAQDLLGEEQTGIATLEFQEAIYSNDAPSAMNVLLREGMSGPAVRSLQENLAALGLYDDAVDSVFDVDVVEAVKVFQSAYGYEPDGVATTQVQKAIYYEAGRMKAMFVMDGGYHCERTDEEIPMGRVNCELGIRIREKASVDSHQTGRLKQGDVVVIVEQGKEWTRIMKGKTTGYVKNKYLDVYPQTTVLLRYTSDAGDSVYTIGYSAQDYFSGLERPSEIFASYLAGGGSLDDYEGLARYATVTTDSADVTLNLREAPSTGSAVLAALSDGTQTKVVLRSTEWTLVKYEDMTGYLLNEYLEFWTGPEDALGAEDDDAEPDEEDIPLEDEDPDDIEYAVVRAAGSGKAPVYDQDAADATVLGSLKNGSNVEVLENVEDWCLISYQGHQGYMREADLQFVVEGIKT